MFTLYIRLTHSSFSSIAQWLQHLPRDESVVVGQYSKYWAYPLKATNENLYYFPAKPYLSTETAQHDFEWGAKLDEIFAEGMLGNGYFSKVTEIAFITIKLLKFFHILSDVAIASQNSPSLN